MPSWRASCCGVWKGCTGWCRTTSASRSAPKLLPTWTPSSAAATMSSTSWNPRAISASRRTTPSVPRSSTTFTSSGARTTPVTAYQPSVSARSFARMTAAITLKPPTTSTCPVTAGCVDSWTSNLLSTPARKKCIFSRKKFVQPVRSVLVRIRTANHQKLKRVIVYISFIRTPYEPYRLFELRTRFFRMRTEQSSSHCANLIVTLPQETFPRGVDSPALRGKCRKATKGEPVRQDPTTLCRPQG